MAFLTDEELREYWAPSGIIVDITHAGTYHINGKTWDLKEGDALHLFRLVQKKCEACRQDLPIPYGIVHGGAYK